MNNSVIIAFEKRECILPVSKIIPQRLLPTEYRMTNKYKLIANTMKSVGLIEALVVYPRCPDEYLLLDGHLRLAALKELGVNEVRCTLSTDDEAYTYNKHVNAISSVGQHFMILKALENGISEERLSKALGLDIKNIRVRRDLLNGICPEVVQLLRNKKIAMGVFAVLRKMKAVRQVEAAEHMISGTTYSVAFATALLSVTKPELLVKPTRKPKIAAGSQAAQEMLGLETQRLVRDLKDVEESYGRDVLTLTVWSAYLQKLLANRQINQHLSSCHSSLLEAIEEVIAVNPSAKASIVTRAAAEGTMNGSSIAVQLEH